MIGRPLRRQEDARLLRGQAYWLLYVELGELVGIFGSSSVTTTVPAGAPDFDMTLRKDPRADTP